MTDPTAGRSPSTAGQQGQYLPRTPARKEASALPCVRAMSHLLTQPCVLRPPQVLGRV